MRLHGAFLAWLLLPLGLHSDVLHVPADYATIQAAFDGSSATDTILVRPGTYAEALMAPPHSFTLMGDVIQDTGTYPRPVIDPTTWPDPESRRCLTITTGSGVILDFGFRNGAAIHTDPPAGGAGIFDTTGVRLELMRCDFDSVFGGVGTHPSSLTLAQCRMRDMRGFGAISLSGPVTATDCLFDGPAVYSLVFRGHATITRCEFRGNQQASNMILSVGPDVEIRDCIFGPSNGGMTYAPLDLSSASGLTLQGNILAAMQFTGPQRYAILAHSMWETPALIVTNHLADISGAAAMSLQRTHPDSLHLLRGYIGVVEENTIVSCGGHEFTRGILLVGHAQLRLNRMMNLTGPQAPAVRCFYDSVNTFRENIFLNTDLALHAEERTDARWNWWGDSTGPYHAVQNPAGQGDSIQGPVDFVPWYPDTSFLEVPGIGLPLPESFVFEAYPNPFNSTITLRLIPPEAIIIRVDLFDILGRRVKEIWSGPLAFQKQITFDATDLTSGIYFARVWQPIGHRQLAMEKLVLLK